MTYERGAWSVHSHSTGSRGFESHNTSELYLSPGTVADDDLLLFTMRKAAIFRGKVTKRVPIRDPSLRYGFGWFFYTVFVGFSGVLTSDVVRLLVVGRCVVLSRSEGGWEPTMFRQNQNTRLTVRRSLTVVGDAKRTRQALVYLWCFSRKCGKSIKL